MNRMKAVDPRAGPKILIMEYILCFRRFLTDILKIILLIESYALGLYFNLLLY